MTECDVLISGANDLGISLSPAQVDALIRYVDSIYAANEHVNLTRVPRSEAVVLHILDSLTLAQTIDLNRVKTLVDIGTGAGFPGAVIKIAFPHIHVTLVDSTAKKLTKVQEALDELGIEGWQCVHGRAEDLSHLDEHRAKYDVVTARAVAPMHKLAAWMLPFAKPTGSCIAMKSEGALDEIEMSGKALHSAGGQLDHVIETTIPGTDIPRLLVVVKRQSVRPVRRKPGALR
jgi:16S rRNA (guanine527-N7)-methyltransferase